MLVDLAVLVGLAGVERRALAAVGADEQHVEGILRDEYGVLDVDVVLDGGARNLVEQREQADERRREHGDARDGDYRVAPGSALVLVCDFGHVLLTAFRGGVGRGFA